MHIRIPYVPSPYVTALREDHVLVEGHLDLTGEVLTAELTSYAGVLPLVPGDQVVVTDIAGGDAVATRLHQQRDCWLVEINIRVPEADDAAHEHWAAAELGAEMVAMEIADFAEVDRPSKFTIAVATDDFTWLQAYIAGSANVRSYTLLRQPGCVVDLDFERADLRLTDRPEYDVTGTKVWG